ncbi:fatty acid--CoA ligase [Methylopila sp. M107]|uniref:fatty acid--CoA ligase n=1 Tax=Methylopila sp. M107 TaxID=1101190 RepID=UPI00039C1A1C|nr:fatty acid--CoA ligase [Methylopila sp. M107]
MGDNLIVHAPSSYAYPMLIKRILETGTRRAPDQSIVYADKKRQTYVELEQRVARLASGLGAAGVKLGDTVAVMDWDSNRYLECFFAVPMMGAVLHTINIRLSPEQILYTINHAADDVIVVHPDFLNILEQIWDRVETSPKLILIEEGGEPNTPLPIHARFEPLLGQGSDTFDFPDFDEDTRATTFYTTGTTGLPKGVYFSHRQLVAHTMAFAGELKGAGHGSLNPQDVYMPLTPMFHVHAWGLPYVATFVGCKQVYPGRMTPDVVLDLIGKEGATFSHCVPTILQMVLRHPRAGEVNLEGWKMIIGGAALPQALAREAMLRGIDLFTGYGMSETCPILTLSRLDRDQENDSLDRQIELRCKAGRPIPFVEVRVVDDELRDVPHDGVSPGEVVARAPWLTQGYLHDPENSEKLWLGGWLHTGDIGVIDSRGWLKITDRMKDVIKTGGEWVSSIDVEDILLKAANVAEAAVIGIPDPKWTERPLAIVVPKPGEALVEAEIKAHLQAYAEKGVISKYAVPDRIVFVSELPRTSVGKLDKKELRALYAK